MIFSQYTETCEVILDYPRIVVDAIEDYAKKFISNLYYEHIDVHSKIFIAVFPIDGIKCIGKLQSHCANMTFFYERRYDRTFQQVTYKGGESSMNYINRFQNAQYLSISVGNSYSEDQLTHRYLDNFHQVENVLLR